MAIESQGVDDSEAIPPAICFQDDAGCRIAFAALPVRDFGVLRAWPLGPATAPPPTALRIFLRTPLFNYVAATGALLDELCWGCGGAFTADLEASLIQMVVAVGEDLEAAVARMSPVMSLVAGAAQESEHMLTQMKKDVAAALQNDHRSLALGRLHQFLDQLLGNGCDMAMLMSLPQSFKDAAAAFVAAKAACLNPAKFRRMMSVTRVAAVRLRAHLTSSPSAAFNQSSSALSAFIDVAAHDPLDESPVTAAQAQAAALLKPNLLGPRISSLLFMPVLTIEELQVQRCAPSTRCNVTLHCITQLTFVAERGCVEAPHQHHVRACRG